MLMMKEMVKELIVSTGSYLLMEYNFCLKELGFNENCWKPFVLIFHLSSSGKITIAKYIEDHLTCCLFFAVKLNGGRHVQGILRGFDPFMNLVIDECVEMAPGGQQNNIGMVVIRGNSIIMLEALERV
ncbi:small nuclear ribonucleoprotein G isoform 1-T1 [Vipera latastei]